MSSSNKFDLADLKDALSSVDDINARVRKRIELENLGRGITPHLARDGSNFNLWYNSLSNLIEDLYEVDAYFSNPDEDTDKSRDRTIQVFISKSIHQELLSYTEGHYSAKSLFQSLQKRFQHKSWSQAMVIFNRMINLDESTISVDEGFTELQNLLRELKSSLGGVWTDDSLLALFFHQFNKTNFHHIANALDAKKSIDPSCVITAREIMQVAQRFQQREVNSITNVMALTSARPRADARPSRYPHTSMHPAAWATKWLSPEHPCSYCFQWGHWAMDCPQKSAGKSPIEDPRKKDPNFRYRKSEFVLHPALVSVEAEDQGKANVASIGASTEDSKLVLIDSGATHHVAGNRLFFITYKKINLELSVATTAKHPVVGIGTIKLYTPDGDLYLHDALHCEEVPGLVISLGRFNERDGQIKFRNGVFSLRQHTTCCNSVILNNRWFLNTISNPCCNEIILPQKNIMPTLIHDRLAHISMRTVRRMKKLACVEGLPSDVDLRDIPHCRSCTLAKSRHTPIMPASRQIACVPGDVIVVDLMGPFPLSVDKFLYAMIIQDHFSSLVAFIPLKAKSDAAKHLRDWLVQFASIAHTTIKRVRTDNGGEFNSSFLSSFFKEKGIIHEKTIPYEHHQNGKVERTNRTLAEAERSMMIHANLPPIFWTYALRHAAWVFNRVLHNTNVTTPYEAVIKRKPSLTLLRVFGCKAFIHNRTQKKDLTAKAKEVIHLGVAQDSQGWVFYDPATGGLIRSASVIFKEDMFSRLGEKGKIDLNSIELNDIFDDRLIREMREQDECLHLLNVSSMYCNGAPTTYHEAKKTPQALEWMTACEEELMNLKNMNVWEEVEHDSKKQTLGTRWVFALKMDSNGKPIRHKARLVVQGHRQIRGVNFEETFAPTPSFATLRSILAIAGNKSWKVNTFDVTSAYLHSKIDEDILVRPPPGVNIGENKVLKLKRALYGLKQAGRCWWIHLKNILQEVGFKVNENDQSTYTYKHGGEYAMLWIHVDDGVLVASSDNVMEKLKLELETRLKLKWDEGINSIVGIEVKREGKGFILKQPGLIRKLAQTTGSHLTANQPLPDIKLESSPASQIDRDYLSAIGMILYLAQATRPDVMYAVNYLARFAMNAQDDHWKALKHLIDYINTTKHQHLRIGGDHTGNTMEVYVDANWGGEGSRSQHGFCILLHGTMLAWNSKRQSCIASSTCQAEYMALSFAAREVLWLVSNVEDVIGQQRPILMSDNKSAIQIANNSSSRKKSRHIDREFHIINEMVVNGKVTIEWIASAEQLADIFTKAQGKIKTRQFRDYMEGLWGGVLRRE
ncbi:hypothetical protein O181_078655 [Austropuccinia psidii MF-1]|uniref:Integrase catalytic domain-containing protein n=1 Tax=Austropuccinia psidii MF-1 TaxID=1389203 RepID=A0A9Q3FK22_9BASI|nr:hypothetical protein [Austropuccinia psidii MF-1]